MVVYADVFFLINFAVDFLLLAGSAKLLSTPVSYCRCGAGAVVGAAYASACLIPGLYFLGNPLWRAIGFFCMAATAYGLCKASIRKAAVFVFLSMALGGIASALGQGKGAGLLLSLMLLGGLAFFVFRSISVSRKTVPMKLQYGSKIRYITALIDTGNLLRDPLSGESVTVVGADLARDLLDLDVSDPIRAVSQGSVRGMRLIPYHAVGTSGGMLAGIKLDGVWIDGKEYSKIIAFSPTAFDDHYPYQALAGGISL